MAQVGILEKVQDFCARVKALFRPRTCKKICWVADALTLSRGLVAFVILIEALLPTPMDYSCIAIIYIVALLTDAVDGVWARTFKHPESVWKWPIRHYASQIDIVCDIALVVAMGAFISNQHVGPFSYWWTAWLFALAVFCSIVEILKRWNIIKGMVRKTTVLTRRVIYVATIIFMAEYILECSSYRHALPGLYEVLIVYTPFLLQVSLLRKFDQLSEKWQANCWSGVKIFISVFLWALLIFGTGFTGYVLLRIIVALNVRNLLAAVVVLHAVVTADILLIIRYLKPDRASQEVTPTIYDAE